MTNDSVPASGSPKTPATPAKGQGAELSDAELQKVSGGDKVQSDVSASYSKTKDNIVNNLRA